MDTKKFFDTIKPLFGKFTQDQVKGIDFLITKANAFTDIKHKSYFMATIYHETARTMQPINEYGKGKGKPYGVAKKYQDIPYGRGYVQLTWDYNYEKADKELGLNGELLKSFEKALEPEIAAQIAIRGMKEGWFTGKKLSDYDNYISMRRIINGKDKAYEIAEYAKVFEKAFNTLPKQ
jgi:putative chitinase